MSLLLQPDEETRLQELRRYALLDTPPEKAFDDITALAARIFKMPIAAVTLIDSERQWFKSCVGLETREVGRNFAFCAHAILTNEVMVVPDAQEDTRFAHNPLVTGPPHIRFYAGAPLRTSNGLNLGTLTVSDSKPRRFSKASIEMLAGLAKLVVGEIELRYEQGERRRAAESLRLLQAAIQQSTESVMITTADLEKPGPEIVFVNPAFTRLTGFAAADAVGKTPRILQGKRQNVPFSIAFAKTLSAEKGSKARPSTTARMGASSLSPGTFHRFGRLMAASLTLSASSGMPLRAVAWLSRCRRPKRKPSAPTAPKASSYLE